MRLEGSPSWIAAAGLVLANTVPLAGVLWFGWDLHSLLVVYWIESGAIGVTSVAKILGAQGTDDPEDLPSMELNDRSVESFVGRSNRSIAGFFSFHYGGFWAVHGLFVFLFVTFPGVEPASPSVVAVAAVGLAAYHAVSYKLNYVGNREYEGTGPVTQMVEPYRRVLVLHVTIVLGAFAIAWIGAPVGALVVMVLLKTLLDLRGHWKEHDRARQRIPSAGSAA